MDRFGGIHLFMQAAQTRSFVEAGRLSGVSASAVGKAVARLEERLGVRLFHRSTRSVTLTPEGQLFLDHCQRIQAEMMAAEAALAGARTTPAGPLRIAIPAVAEAALLPLLSGFMRAYPDIMLEIDASDRLVDLIEEGFDAAIRTGTLADSRLMGRRLGGFRHQIVASPTYLAERGTPQMPADLCWHACLHHRHPVTGKPEPWPLIPCDDTPPPDLPVTGIAGTAQTRAMLAADGLGIACIPDFVARPLLEAGRLVDMLGDQVMAVGQFHLLWPAGRHLSPRIRVFLDHVTAGFALTSG
ncbi:LysR family transcriptional regulator [Niveispirillum cyanobacteriorum]|uniref:LysR family transcriptional regulator n=1 Tax=Niveispirillum cyanobacteriorum TaxID=1612173 RepID=A0A2K9NE86_9PROT|nr:LysR family transcriptional regulator [Niveispirillum cyanobacteriorum]AUN31399.1 LysR family transcriptional regulator [Niveispirillum cyanobacteriorum]GGE71481.1 transcriptional regulator [Niveispirillum cyanobacteriorum]